MLITSYIQSYVYNSHSIMMQHLTYDKSILYQHTQIKTHG